MLKLKKGAFLFLFFFCCTGGFGRTIAAQDGIDSSQEVFPLSITLSSVKKEYRVNEKFAFLVTWKNVSAKPIRVRYSQIREGFNFVITDPAGIVATAFETVEYKYMVSENNFPVIEPGKTFSFTVKGEIFAPGRYDRLLDPVINNERLHGMELGGTGRVLKPGKYNIRYRYKNDKDRTQLGRKIIGDILTGAVLSNPITVEVKS